MFTASAIPASNRCLELTPLDIVALEVALEPFCPISMNGGHYQPTECLPWCRICADLLLKNGGTA